VSIKTGNIGESKAAEYLKGIGYSVVEKNYRHKRNEIDLIVKKDELLVFVEVKTRTSGEVLEGYHAVNASKRRILRSAGQAYLKRYAPVDRALSYRLDVVVVCLTPEGKVGQIGHFRNLPLFS